MSSGVIRVISPLNVRKKGVFLVEVLILTLILGIIAVPLIYSLNTILRAFKVSNDFTKSIYLAESVLFQEIKNPNSVEEEEYFPSPNEGFKWELKRKPPDDSGLYEARVTIKDYPRGRVYAELVTLVKGQ